MQVSVFDSLKYPTKFKAELNTQEELFAIGWSIIEDEVDRLLNKATLLSRKGKDPLEVLKAANVFFYLVQYAIILRNQSDLKECPDYDDFKLDCVESNITCLSLNADADYKTAWYKLKEEFGITELCEDCCVGIGKMQINGTGCDALIVTNDC
jgi:hypothetical protein